MSKVKSMSNSDEFGYLNTTATRMLKEGLDKAAAARGLSMRGAARELGYKAAVVISHMAAGRVPIPLERAADIARVVGLPVDQFCVAVLEQRYPNAFPELAAAIGSAQPTGLAQELAELAGQPLDSLPAENQRVLREVASDRAPGRRWLSVSELPTALLLRKLRPAITTEGLTARDSELIGKALA